MPLRDGKDNGSHEGQISIKMNKKIDAVLKEAISEAQNMVQAQRIAAAAVVNTAQCAAFGISPNESLHPTEEAICVAALMAYFSAPVAENGGFLMEISPERWLDAVNGAEKILGRKPDAGLNKRFISVLREYESNATSVLSNFLKSKEGGQSKSVN